MREARDRGADVVHFPEGALSGYVGADRASHADVAWEVVRDCALRIKELAGELGLWVILGTSHRLTAPNKPHNSLYIIDDHGQLVDRYDKRFCAGDASGTTGELAHYTPGDHPCLFGIRGVRCAALICHEYRYPELYRDYKRQGAQLVFHSFHAANVSPQRLAQMRGEVGEANGRIAGGSTYPEITMPAAMIASAAANHVWISSANSSARFSCWGSFFVRADGVITGRLERHATDVLLSEIDTEAPLYDATTAWRDRAIAGVFHSGELVEDRRSENRTEL
jgi:predicted amidohydrolase